MPIPDQYRQHLFVHRVPNTQSRCLWHANGIDYTGTEKMENDALVAKSFLVTVLPCKTGRWQRV